MRKESSQDGGSLPPLTSEQDVGSARSDFDDSIVKELLALQPWPRLPLSKERLGGRDGLRFEIRGVLGHGGMGQVFRAWDEELQRVVALKFLLPYRGFTSLALQEARAIARLDHENIVRIFDVAEWYSAPGEPCIPFLVMECLEGESLAGLLKQERKPGLRRALEILEAIATGLEHAHQRHIIHRDLKPSNVFISRLGVVKLLDFGLAHLSVNDASVSQRLIAAGTPAYMAPEQWRGEPQDERTDIWAAGLVLFEMLTGRLPFQGASSKELRVLVSSDDPMPSVRDYCPEVPRKVEGLLATALAKEPGRRFQTARELREELRELEALLTLESEPAGAKSPSAESQRSQVTLLSCRLTGLGGGSGDQLDVEDLGELETVFQQTCTEIIQQHGGRSPPQYMGSGLLACFGCHQVREDDSERAVLAGLHLVRNLPAVLRRRLPYLPAALAVCVGIRTDKVVLQDASSDSRERTPTLHGEAPSIAAWLSRQAQPGEVVIGETTWRLVLGGFVTEPLGTRSFEGLAGTVHLEVHRVLREVPRATRIERALAAGGLTPLVGRRRELDRLLKLWEWARRGQGACVLLRGEAGIGKSRLILELREHVSSAEATWIHLQCWSRFNARAHSLVLDLLQDVVQLSGESTPEQQLKELEEQLGTRGVSAEQAHLIGELLALPLPEGSPLHLLTPERRRDQAFEALRDLLLQRSRERPVLVTVEDLHWAFSTHLEFLSYMLDSIERERILVVLSARPEFRSSWSHHPWEHQLTLERLPAGQASTLVKEVAGRRGLPAEMIQYLVSRTDGIPLFIEEMTRMVLELTPAACGGPECPIPITLHELLLARLDMLPSRQKTLAQLCAVVGRGFTFSFLSALSEPGVVHGGAVLQRELSGLVDAGLLQEQSEPGSPAYEFRHALIQDAAYQSLSRGTRRQYHLRIAHALAEHSPKEVQERPEVLAHHYTEAGEFVPALHYWAQAGRQAALQYANQEAVGYLSRALELLRRLPDSDERRRQELQIQVGLGIVLVQMRGYLAPEVERTFARVRELFYQVGEALPRLELAYWGIYSYHFARAEYPLAHELAEWLVDLGRRQHNQEMLAQGYRMMATDFFFWGRLRESLEGFEHAMAVSHFDLEQHRALAVRYLTNPLTSALAHTSIVLAMLGQPERSRQRARESVELAQRIGHPHTMAYALTYLAAASQFRRDVHLALKWADEAIAISSERGFWLWNSWSKLIRIWALAELGRPEDHLEELKQGIERWLARGVRAGMPNNCAVLAGFHLKLGQIEEGQRAVSQGLDWVEKTGERGCEAELHRLRGELLRTAGREAEAKDSFLRAIAVARSQASGLFELRATVSLGRLLRDQGQPELSRQLLMRLLESLAGEGDSPDIQEARALLEEEASPARVP
ncbi:protein kinase domain-containing protein [Archangium lansingense]|uniref:protein kinase domain-containing protein n=1 Tax=Archangium lansingense TaxID=2995310 RepID=UPI003B7D5661